MKNGASRRLTSLAGRHAREHPSECCLPPWEAVYQQSRRWLDAGCFEAMVSDLRSIIRMAQGRQGQPSAAVTDGRTLQSSCESGPRAGYDGYKRRAQQPLVPPPAPNRRVGIGPLAWLTGSSAHEPKVAYFCIGANILGYRA